MEICFSCASIIRMHISLLYHLGGTYHIYHSKCRSLSYYIKITRMFSFIFYSLDGLKWHQKYLIIQGIVGLPVFLPGLILSHTGTLSTIFHFSFHRIQIVLKENSKLQKRRKILMFWKLELAEWNFLRVKCYLIVKYCCLLNLC